jgi:hypothetical protein
MSGTPNPCMEARSRLYKVDDASALPHPDDDPALEGPAG